MAMILVLENEIGIGMLLRQVLTRHGHQVEVVTGGEEAISRIEAGGVELLISDLFLSGMGGIEVIQALQERQISLPVLVISGFIDASVQAELAALPAVKGWLRKPFDLVELLARVEAALQPAPEPALEQPRESPTRPRPLPESDRAGQVEGEGPQGHECGGCGGTC